MNILDKIKTDLLTNYPQYNDGYANVSKPSGTEIVMDENGNYSGISDNKGNYFYIRDLKEATYRPFNRSCRVLSYEKTSTYRIVSITSGLNEEELQLALLTAISENGCVVSRSVSSKTQVFFEETGTRNITDSFKNVSLLLLDFEQTSLISAKNCKTLNCEC
jgi:hypothetical protein